MPASREPTAAAVHVQLARLVSSPIFLRSDRLRRFLSFGVEAVLAGHASALREHAIGVAVYDRQPSYDVRVDPIVRVEAARLRARLREYYEADGLGDDLLIEIPKGA
jgi:serine/threonine-protein kinase